MDNYSIDKQLKETNVNILQQLTDLTSTMSSLSIKEKDPFMFQMINNKLSDIKKEFDKQKSNLDNIKEMSSKFDSSLPIPEFGKTNKFDLNSAYLSCGRLNEHRKLLTFYRKFYGFVTRNNLSEKASINLLLDLTVGPLYDVIFDKKDSSLKEMLQLLIDYMGEVSYLESDISKLLNFTRSPSETIGQTMGKISELISRTEVIVPEKNREYRAQKLKKEYLLKLCSSNARSEILQHEKDCIKAGIVPSYSVLLEIAKNHDISKELSLQSYPVNISEKHPNFYSVKSDDHYEYFYDVYRRKMIKLRKLNFPYIRQWIDYNPFYEPIHQSFSLARYDHFEDELF